MVRHIVLWKLKSAADTDFASIRARRSKLRHADPLIAEHWIADYEL
jgi:hypothetical protein